MRKKLFTFLLALVASVGMSWASVTWISDQYGNYEEKGYYAGTPFTKDGVTVTMSDDAFFIVSYWGDASLQCVKGTFGPTAGNYVFSNSLGENFVKIIIAAGYTSDWEWFPKGDGWVLSGDEDNGYILTWTGNASTVTLMDNELHSVNQSIEGDIVFMFESDSEAPDPVVVTANTLQLHVNDALMGSVAVTNLLGSGIVDNGDGTYAVPDGAEVTLQATPNDGYEFVGWKASSSICDFNDCEFIALSTVANPLTFDMYQEAAFMAEFAAVAPQPQPEGDGKLTGAFTINADGDQIVFSKGNLQYQASTTTWQFATNQYDMIGEDNANISDTYTGWIDLFGWGTGNCPTKKSTVDEDYSTFTDWGTNAISNGGNEANLWRTLTIQEWGYLIKTRANADDLKGQATVADVHGFVLLPDSWTLPAGLSFTAIPNDWTTNVYTAEQWAQMEDAGAVFLPATGYRNPDIVYVGEKGWYWSSDVLTANAAYDFEFTETTSRVFGSRHYFGQPVRLVTAYDAPAPQPVTDPITPYADPQDASVYYSTFFDSSVKYELPAGVEAYVADLSGANLLLTKIAEAGEVIPANVAVILKSSVDQFTLTVSDADAVTFTATNDLQGSDTQIATPANCYVLAGTDGVVGFYHYTAANLNAHKAYVVYSGSNQAPRRMPFIFDQATGVENVQNSDIRSQKVVENGQLIIIKNGVKYNAQGQIVK